MYIYLTTAINIMKNIMLTVFELRHRNKIAK